MGRLLRPWRGAVRTVVLACPRQSLCKSGDLNAKSCISLRSPSKDSTSGDDRDSNDLLSLLPATTERGRYANWRSLCESKDPDMRRSPLLPFAGIEAVDTDILLVRCDDRCGGT